MQWSRRRQFIYLSATFALLFVIIYGLFLVFWYKPPTCTDGVKNGDETGVDCGGSCQTVCPAETIQPIVRWARSLYVAKGMYNSVALIENPNINSAVSAVAYEFKVYDNSGVLITKREGTTFIPPKSIFAVFEGGIATGERIPARTTFEFTSPLNWHKETAIDPVSVTEKIITDQDIAPRINATVTNSTYSTLADIEATVIVSDGNGNAIAASRTFVQDLGPQEKKDITFTWPQPFVTGSGICAVPVDTVLVIDRSGSMQSDSVDPPEPLTSVKDAAKVFINQLEGRDRGAVVSFANTASSPIDKALTGDTAILSSAINNISISQPADQQNTNIAGGLAQAYQELIKDGRVDAHKVIVLLTDGIASRPLKDGVPDYPNQTASTTAATIHQSGIDLYTVGLGSEVEGDFLRGLASTPSGYFAAPQKEDLKSIYESIASTLCRSGPATIQIITRVYPTQ